MIAESGAFRYLNEPFNPDERARVWVGVAKKPFKRFNTYVDASNEAKYFKPLSRLFHGHHSRWRLLMAVRKYGELKRVNGRYRRLAEFDAGRLPPLVKDPIALVSAEWLAHRFGMSVLIMIRHPAAFVASMKRLNWGFSPRNDFLWQDALMRDRLAPFQRELNDLDRNGGDIVDQACVLWKCLYHIVLCYRRKHEDWIFVRHEEISMEPVAAFQEIYTRLGLSFDDRVRRKIEEHSSPFNPASAEGEAKRMHLDSKKNISAWKNRLTPDEIARIRRQVEPVASEFYADADW